MDPPFSPSSVGIGSSDIASDPVFRPFAQDFHGTNDDFNITQHASPPRQRAKIIKCKTAADSAGPSKCSRVKHSPNAQTHPRTPGCTGSSVPLDERLQSLSKLDVRTCSLVLEQTKESIVTFFWTENVSVGSVHVCHLDPLAKMLHYLVYTTILPRKEGHSYASPMDPTIMWCLANAIKISLPHLMYRYIHESLLARRHGLGYMTWLPLFFNHYQVSDLPSSSSLKADNKICPTTLHNLRLMWDESKWIKLDDMGANNVPQLASLIHRQTTQIQHIHYLLRQQQQQIGVSKQLIRGLSVKVGHVQSLCSILLHRQTRRHQPSVSSIPPPPSAPRANFLHFYS